MIIFLFLIAKGVIKLHGKGVQFFDCFESDMDNELFEQMKEASINGMVSRAAKKLNKSIEQINHELFEIFDQHQIQLARVPINVLNYSIEKPLSDELAEVIHETLKNRMEIRLANFEKLTSFINSKADPIKTISEHLGV